METHDLVYDICRDYLEDQPDLQAPLKNRLLGMIRARNLKGLADAMSLYNPTLYGLYEFRVLRQIGALFKKNALFVNDDECLQTASKSFNRAEKICRITNRRLDFYYVQRDRLDPDLNLWMSRMERSIHGLLSEFKPFLEILPTLVKMTSGATATRSRRQSLPTLKLSREIDCSPRAKPYLAALQTFYGYRAVKFKDLSVNRVEFVPKNYKTHRTIACEPTGNIPLQLAFDHYVKRQLRKKFKVDLSSQVLNQRLAKEGSITGEFATVDLSMASDTLSLNTVRWLLPEDWYKYVSDIRSSHYVEPDSGRFRPYSKFSSMGNGTTFVLETLIFAAAVRAVGSTRYAVYGDDIVIESHLYEPLSRLLSFLGFTINSDKSYCEGPFRESCGKDYYNGVNVTPFYLREWGKRKSILSHNVNGLAGISRPEGRLWHRLRDLIDSRRLQLVPFNEDTMTGVHIDTQTCYDLRLLRYRKKLWTPEFRAYIVKQPTMLSDDSRSLFLWYLSRLEQPGGESCEDLWYPVMGSLGLPKVARRSSVRIPDRKSVV